MNQILCILIITFFLNLAAVLPSSGQIVEYLKITKTRDGSKQIANIKRKHQLLVEFQLRNRINSLAERLKISDEQKMKLESGAQIAIRQFVNKEVEEQVKKLLIKHKDDFDTRDIEPFRLKLLVAHAEKIEDSPKWNQSLKTTLSPGQHKKFQEHRVKQKLRMHNIAISSFMVRLESVLVLSADQKKEMRKIIEKNFSKMLMADILVPSIGIANFSSQRAMRRYDELVKGILTEGQLEIWRRRFAPVLYAMQHR